MKNLILIAALAIGVVACKKEKAEDPEKTTTNPPACPTISYSTDIQPIFSASCASGSTCHSTASADDGVVLDTYSGANAVNTDRLMGAIKHEAGYSNMPQIGAKLSDENIQKIQCWIDQGKQNN